MVKRILSGLRNDNQDSRVPYKIEESATGKLIYTDAVDAEVEILMDNTNYVAWPMDMKMASGFALASYSGKALGLKLSTSLRQQLQFEYKQCLSAAQANAIHEEQDDLPPDSDLLRARE